MYEPPIKINYGDPEFQTIRGLRDKTEQTILYAVMDVGIQVDKDELEKALRYDRDQYAKGYRDGADAGRKIGSWEYADYVYDHIVCSECGHIEWEQNRTPYCPNCGARMISMEKQDDD